MSVSPVLFSGKTDMWATPQWLFDELDNEFHFTLDVCATPENAKCNSFYTKEQDGLRMPWTGVCWCNPPYGKEIGKWVEKAHKSAEGGGNGSYACAKQNRHKMVSRLCVQEGGNPFY